MRRKCSKFYWEKNDWKTLLYKNDSLERLIVILYGQLKHDLKVSVVQTEKLVPLLSLFLYCINMTMDQGVPVQL